MIILLTTNRCLSKIIVSNAVWNILIISISLQLIGQLI